MNFPVKILHLEDVCTDAELVSLELQKGTLAFDKLHVENRNDYINALRSYRPDIVLSDHSLPSFNSMEALTILKNSGLNIPFILVTSAISEEYAAQIMKAGAADYILKDRMQRLSTAIYQALEKNKLEAEYQKTSESLNLLFDTIDEVFFSRDIINSKLTKISPACEKMFGYTVSEFLNAPKLLKDILHHDDQLVKEENYKKLTLGQTVKSQFRIIHKGGSTKWVESKIIPVLDETGVLVKTHGVTRDITEQKKAEEAILQSQAHLRAVFEYTDLSIIIFDKHFNILSFNGNASSFIKARYDFDLAVGNSALESIKNNRFVFDQDSIAMLQQNKMVYYERSYIPANGIVEWFEVKWNCLPNENSFNIGFVLTIKNISEKKVAEMEREKITADLVKRNNDLEQFSYIISHNLRVPVANIIGLSDLLQACASDNTEHLAWLDALLRSTKRLDEVILDLNDILQTNSQVNEKIENVYFIDIVDSVKTSISNLIKKEQVRFILNFTNAASICSLKNYLHSIFYNLIINSIKYRNLSNPPVIDISSFQQDDKIIIKFKDNGRGIDMDRNAKNVFGLYKRFDFSVEGKGMGLFMVKTQVENIGGKINITSKLNKGTEFVVELPIPRIVNQEQPF